MSWISRIWAFRRRDNLASEIDEELQYRLSRLEELKAREGMPPEEARMAARRHFGNPTLLKETIREIDVLNFCETVARDIRFATRMLAKHPGFTMLAVLALAVGIGVNTAVFTAYKAVFLQPLDAKDPGQLVNGRGNWEFAWRWGHPRATYSAWLCARAAAQLGSVSWLG